MTVDFACLQRRLAVEVDGEGHSRGDQPMRDAARDALLRPKGFRVIRIAARDVLNNLDGVLQYIVATCSEAGPLHHDAARRGPPPRSGEEYTNKLFYGTLAAVPGQEARHSVRRSGERQAREAGGYDAAGKLAVTR
jgi:hypothetical protein